jgi:hypothetical protein
MMARIKAETNNHCELLMVLWRDGVFDKYISIDWHNGECHLKNVKRNQTFTELCSYVILFLRFLIRAA